MMPAEKVKLRRFGLACSSGSLLLALLVSMSTDYMSWGLIAVGGVLAAFAVVAPRYFRLAHAVVMKARDKAFVGPVWLASLVAFVCVVVPLSVLHKMRGRIGGRARASSRADYWAE